MLQFLYGLMSVLLRWPAAPHVVEPAIILIININGRVAAPLLLVAGTLRGHLGWARWSRRDTDTLDTVLMISPLSPGKLWKYLRISHCSQNQRAALRIFVDKRPKAPIYHV